MENIRSLRNRIIVVHRKGQRLTENVQKLVLDLMVTTIRRPQRLFQNQLQLLAPLPQPEVGAHGSRQDFIVSSITLLFADQTVEMLH
jgi:hypothetical protein